MRRAHDLTLAFILSSCFALAAAATVPLLLPSLPDEARNLPLPLPAFCGILVVQMTTVYGLLGFAGLRMARARSLDPTPGWIAAYDAVDVTLTITTARNVARFAQAFGLGLACGLLLVLSVTAIQRLLPDTLPNTLHPPGIVAALFSPAPPALWAKKFCFDFFF